MNRKVSNVVDVESYLQLLSRKFNNQILHDTEVRVKIIELLKEAITITGLSMSDLLSGLDFKQNDQTVEALESFLAELRSIFWLRNFGFTNIIPLRSMATIGPDFTAKYFNQNCSVEVFCLTKTHEQQRSLDSNLFVNFELNSEGSKSWRDFITKAREKKIQLDSVGTQMKLLLCVVNSSSITRLSTATEMQSDAKFLHDQLGWGSGYFIGLLTGMGSDVIYPKLSI